jgi:hypothetical protein
LNDRGAGGLAASPDDVFNQTRTFNDRMGSIGHLLFFGQDGFLDHKDTEANISLFGREVAPRLHEIHAPAAAQGAAAAD